MHYDAFGQPYTVDTCDSLLVYLLLLLISVGFCHTSVPHSPFHIKVVNMNPEQPLTEEEHAIVRDFCDDIDKYLSEFKQCPNIEEGDNFITLTSLVIEIVHLEEVVRTPVTNYLASKEEVLHKFRLHLDTVVKRSISSSPTEDMLSLESCIIGLTNCSDDMCLTLGQRGFLQVLSESLRISNFDECLTETALAIIYNCCWRVAENRVICREFTDILQECSQSKNPGIQAEAFLALSYIVDKSEVHKISLNEPCLEFLLLALDDAVSAPDRKSPGDFSYSVLEVLQGLNQLAINDSNKLLIVELDGIDVLERILMEEESSNDERLWAARAIWQLAFKEENKVKIRQRMTLLDALTNVKETTENGEVLEACSGALFVIKDVLDIDDVEKGHTPPHEDRGHRSGESEVPSSLRVEGHIMISYQHDSQERMLHVKRYLEESGYDVWMDVDKMKGDILDAMAKAVQGASLVLVCMTRKFKESQHCRTEATYAYTLNKDIIPLMLQEHFSPEDWLGALTGMKKYYPMFSKDVMRQSLPDLVKELGDRGKRRRVVPVLEEVTGTSPPTSGRRQKDETAADEADFSGHGGGMIGDKPTGKEDKENSRSEKSIDIDTWGEEEAGAWLRSNGVDTRKDVFRQVDGTRLMQIKNLLNIAPGFCLKSLRKDLGLDFWDVLSLVDALKKV